MFDSMKIESLPSPRLMASEAAAANAPIAASHDFMHILKLNDAIDCVIIYRE